MNSKGGPIGVFDSGYGGLTILENFRKTLPGYDYLYLGDNARAPYGNRSFDLVYEFTRQAVMKLKAGVTDVEIKRLSVIDSVSPKYFKENFTEQDDLEEALYLKDTPCKYLSDKKCRIYGDRPAVCKSYPHTHLNDFNSRTLEIIANTAICPIVFNLFELLKRELGFRNR